MKKLKFFLLIAFTALALGTSHSQTSKHSYLLGGSGSLSFGTESTYRLVLYPDAGYFLSEDFCLGASTPLVFGKDEYDSYQYLGLSPFIRYYFGENDPSRFFGLARLNITLVESRASVYESIVDLGIGHVWFLNSSIGLETSLVGYFGSENVKAGLNFGIQVYFDPKKD